MSTSSFWSRLYKKTHLEAKQSINSKVQSIVSVIFFSKFELVQLIVTDKFSKKTWFLTYVLLLLHPKTFIHYSNQTSQNQLISNTNLAVKHVITTINILQDQYSSWFIGIHHAITLTISLTILFTIQPLKHSSMTKIYICTIMMIQT